MQNGKNLKLVTLDAEIEIDISKPGWCRFWLRQAGNVTDLGAESLKYVKRNFLLGLSDQPREISGKIDGYDVFWILTTSENHHVLYFAREAGVLLWQNADAIVISTIKISPHEKSDWIDQLESL